jgi:hypothetical protein
MCLVYIKHKTYTKVRSRSLKPSYLNSVNTKDNRDTNTKTIYGKTNVGILKKEISRNGNIMYRKYTILFASGTI